MEWADGFPGLVLLQASLPLEITSWMSHSLHSVQRECLPKSWTLHCWPKKLTWQCIVSKIYQLCFLKDLVWNWNWIWALIGLDWYLALALLHDLLGELDWPKHFWKWIPEIAAILERGETQVSLFPFPIWNLAYLPSLTRIVHSIGCSRFAWKTQRKDVEYTAKS